MKFYCLLCLLFVSVNIVEASANKEVASLAVGKGSFEFVRGGASTAQSISIFYYKPEPINKDTRVIMVIPGTGRNASEYRDSWVASADKYNLLVLSPKYPEEAFDFAAYHLGGVVSGLKLNNPKIEMDNGRVTKYRLVDEDIRFATVNNASLYLFNDFDKIFDYAQSLAGTTQQHYDLFGHSAGGQILHRYAIFKPGTKAGRIVASNSGFYTLPSASSPFPFGLQGVNLAAETLKQSFSNKLVLLLGEKDDRNETKGTMLHTPTVDSHGLGRLERGKYFYQFSKAEAKLINANFKWKLKLVKGIGHDYKKMGEAAAKMLYSG